MRPSSYWCPERMNSDESSCGSSCPACEGNPGSPDYYRYPTSSSSSYTSDAISFASLDLRVNADFFSFLYFFTSVLFAMKGTV